MKHQQQRRQSRFSPLYVPIKRPPDAAAVALAEANASAENQLKLQVILAIGIVTLFALGFVTVISLLLLKPQPTGYLVLEPKSSFGAPQVEVDTTNSEAMSLLLSRLTHQLSQASIRLWGPLLGRVNRQPVDCAREKRYPDAREVCIPSVADFGPCNEYAAFGYVSGDPCVLVKAGPQLTRNYSEDVRIACSVSGANLSIAHYPCVSYLEEQFAYLPRYFFPYKPDSPFYLTPMAMVQLTRPPKNLPISLTCWLANADFGNVSTSETLHLLFK